MSQLESENRSLERMASKSATMRPKLYDRPEKSYERPEKSFDRLDKYESDSAVTEIDKYEQENRELRLRVARLESGKLLLNYRNPDCNNLRVELQN